MATRAPVRRIERADARATLGARLRTIRARTLALAARLSPEDQQVQSMADASPTKWHLAHTTWFFETFVLAPNVAGFRCFDEAFGYLFNSYYESVGARHPRPARGLVTRPSLARILDWRARTEDELYRFIAAAPDDRFAAAAPMIDLGLHHEEQHQELILMDVLHLLSLNPLAPSYAEGSSPRPLPAAPSPLGWQEIEGGLVEIGHGGAGFAFDNECPRHKVWLEGFALADRLVTNGEFLEFVESGGYRDPLYWLSDGWAWVAGEGARHPLYWREEDGCWTEFTLHGRIPLDPVRPVAHLSYFEADAYGRFRGVRLPTEAEWECAAERGTDRREANLLEGGALVALAAPAGSGLRQAIGDLWEWTASAYSPYPGFAPAAGAVGEYNGKFMSGQMVLRGGSFATPAGHIRPTYRNFFYPHQRWMFSGLRLARDA